MFEAFANFLLDWLMILGACTVVAGTAYGIWQTVKLLKG